MEFDLENPLTSFKEHQSDIIPALFANESDHMPVLTFKDNDFRFSVRQQAISLLLQAQFTCNFDPFICYLAVNYMDRFISKQEVPTRKPWIPRLLVITCLSLAAKMKNADLSLPNLQREECFIFNAQSIQRMELLILTILNWRMRSITPFSFLYFFLSMFELKDPPSTQALRERASEIIFRVHYEIKFLEYKPSIVAASAILCASQDLFPLQYTCFRTAISSCEYINKEELMKCLGGMQEMERQASMFHAVSSSTKTPIGVLDRHCTNTESEDTTTDTSLPEKDNIKRRKLNGFCSDHAVQLSQIKQC